MSSITGVAGHSLPLRAQTCERITHVRNCWSRGHIAPLDAEAAVKKMVQVLARRGPDSEGIEILAGAVLGHRRLAIFDVSQAGRQPMVSTDGSTGIVFNGAIYNFRDLRAELIARGYSFRQSY